MTSRSIDIHCDDCGAYCHSVYETKDLPEGNTYCDRCQRAHETTQEHFVRKLRGLGR